MKHGLIRYTPPQGRKPSTDAPPQFPGGPVEEPSSRCQLVGHRPRSFLRQGSHFSQWACGRTEWRASIHIRPCRKNNTSPARGLRVAGGRPAAMCRQEPDRLRARHPLCLLAESLDPGDEVTCRRAGMRERSETDRTGWQTGAFQTVPVAPGSPAVAGCGRSRHSRAPEPGGLQGLEAARHVLRLENHRFGSTGRSQRPRRSRHPQTGRRARSGQCPD